MKILYPLRSTSVDTLSDNEKKESKTAGEEIICAILYLEKSDKARFYDLNKRVEMTTLWRRQNTQRLLLWYIIYYWTTNLIITLIGNPNPKVLETNWCSLNLGTPGMVKMKQKRKSKNLKGTLTPSAGMVVVEKATM